MEFCKDGLVVSFLYTVDSDSSGPTPMTEKEIKLVIGAHADVAANLLEAGLDGIELQLAWSSTATVFIAYSK